LDAPVYGSRGLDGYSRRAGCAAGVVMDISLRKERRGYIYPVRQKIARLYQIRIPDMKGQDTGIYKNIKLLGPTEFRYNAVHLSFPNPTIGRFMCKHVAATSGTPDRPGRNRSSTRLGPLAISAKSATSFRTVYLTIVCKNGGELPGPRPLGRTHQM